MKFVFHQLDQNGLRVKKSANKTIESKWAKKSQFRPASILTRSQNGPKSQFGSEQLYYVNCQIVIFVM